ncbi:DNA repair endonuclease XPF [Astathelohania contejeani]|uniref:DNA repair endonuclease XPF n=1 Tax=Astathelohania contejeani TaxID=164912 RepID=A0ABQ7HY15_9MICR|nr:DNA repair endonuclease XPF [Thelohania contejeani]
MLLKYEKEILEKVNQENCLVILAKGLGIQNIILYTINCYLNSENLIILINFEDDYFPIHPNFYRANQASVKRNSDYKNGGVFLVSSRIFILDLINKNIEIEKITGIMVGNAERATDHISFILGIYRQYNRDGFIKAYSDNPTTIYSNSMTPLNRLSDLLKIRKIFTYPRFHQTVINSLEKEIQFIEIKFKLPDKIENLQLILIEILNSLLKELKGLIVKSKRNAFDEQEWNYEMVLNGIPFDKNLFNNTKIKKLIDDLKNIRTLFFILFSVDFKYFYKFCDKICKEEMKNPESTWINSDAGQVLLQTAKDYYVDSEDNQILSENKIQSIRKIVNKGGHITILSSSSLTLKYIKSILNNKEILYLTHKEFSLKTDFIDNSFIKPEFEIIIMVDSALSSIRKIEIISNKYFPLLVYHLIYKESLEEQKYLNEIRNEKSCFEKLINENASLGVNMNYTNINNFYNIYLEDFEKGYSVIVDYREMRSLLPYYLYRAKNTISCAQLEIGDYLLDTSPVICIERKNIYDFIGSINSGRLYSQARMMQSKFTEMYLLLEFERSRCCLYDYHAGSVSDLSEFLIEFPQFKIIWSNSNLMSIRIIRALQEGKEMGERDNIDIRTYTNDSESFNPELVKIILSIPGVDYFNYKIIMKKFKNLKELAFVHQNELINIVGSEKGKMIYNFFRDSIYKKNNEL